MVFLDLAGFSYLLEVEMGKLQEMYSRLSKWSTLNILLRAVTVVPMRTSIHSAVDLRNKSEVNQGTLLF